ncbi:MAG: hypothetical protein Q9210_005452 [Variospora velana]
MHAASIYQALFASFAFLSPCIAAEDVEYIIYPIDDLNVFQSDKLDQVIKDAAVNPEEIDDIFPNEPLVEQFEEYTAQHPAPEELRVISQPPGPERLSRYPSYVYRSDSQKQIFIYHAELGINANHIDFAGRHVEWLYTNRAKFTRHAIETESPSAQKPGHSTCTASKAAGKDYGSSRLATLVVVKMPDLSPLSISEVFSTITDHILENNRWGQSIVTVSWGSKLPIRIEDVDRGGRWSHWRRVRAQVEELDPLSIVLFAAGNAAQKLDQSGRERRNVDTAPTIFAVQSTMFRVLVVSSVDNGGRLWRTSQALLKPYTGRWNAFAPGVQIMCAAHDSTWDIGIKTGTSFAAPLAAGIIADAMATNQIRETSGMPYPGAIMTYARGWRRHVDGESVMWNHVNKTYNPPLNLLVQSLSNETLVATAAAAA